MKARVSWLWSVVILMLAPMAAWAQDGWTVLAPPADNGAVVDNGGARYRPAAVRIKSFDECPLAVAIDWQNTGVAPAGDAWQVRLWVRADGNMVIMPVRAEKVLPSIVPGTPQTEDNCFSLPAGVAAGTYDLYLQVADPQSTRTLKLPLDGGDSDNRYRLGTAVLK